MKKVAISVKQPWAFLVCKGIKPIENRTWPLPKKYIGKRVYIHASSKPAKEPYMLFNDEQAKIIDNIIMDVCGSYEQTSAIIGSVEFVDCVINHPSIWAEKTHYPASPSEHPIKPIYNWVVANPILFDRPIPCKGKLSFWDCTELIKEE